MTNHRIWAFTWCACALVVALGSAASAAPVLSIDFNDDTGAVLTQSGFTSYQQVGSPGTRSFGTSIGTLDVTVSGHDTAVVGGFFDRGAPPNSGAFTYSNLYRDFLFRNNAGSISLSIDGVQPNTDYELTFWSSDRFTDSGFANSITNTIAATGTTTGASGTITFNRLIDAMANLEHSYTGTFRSTTDVLSFSIVDTSSTGVNRATRLNGFQLSAVDAVPEPSAVALWLMLGVAASVWCVRRKIS